jgi:taspase (threonine aspartase 1)
MLARKIYDQAYKSPGLSRVPPNFLAGDGAADFAWINGIDLVPDDDLIAPNARARYESWCKEIAEWEAENPEEAAKTPYRDWMHRPGASMPTRMEIDPSTTEEVRAVPRLGTGLSGLSGVSNPALLKNGKSLDGACSIPQSDSASSEAPAPSEAASTGQDDSAPTGTSDGSGAKKDSISDTVGVIAVDMFGNIAAGSSSGGIGMKHRGRVGPAALIGIGTHVMPVDPTDPDETTVAAVTSGTGEHIATTFAASTCCTRVCYSQRMGQGGCFDNVSEEEAICAMVRNEFARQSPLPRLSIPLCLRLMLIGILPGHPAVVHSEFPGSIGILCVKKNEDGIVFHFAHSTESFVSCDKSPLL